jgi:membrane protease YdiL (CAAX protease family)
LKLRLLVNRYRLPALYGTVIFACEALLRSGAVQPALLAYSLLLLVCLHRAAFAVPSERPLSLAVALIPLMRVAGLTMPIRSVDPGYRYALVAVPALAAAGIAVRRAGYSRSDVGLVVTASALLLCGLMIPVGVVLGLLAHQATGAMPIVSRPAFDQVAVPALALGLSTSIPEELVFRGLLQRASMGQLGRLGGMAYTVSIFAAVSAGSWEPAFLAIVTLCGFLFGQLTLISRSILPAAAGHALFNVTFLVAAPFVMQR